MGKESGFSSGSRSNCSSKERDERYKDEWAYRERPQHHEGKQRACYKP